MTRGPSPAERRPAASTGLCCAPRRESGPRSASRRGLGCIYVPGAQTAPSCRMPDSPPSHWVVLGPWWKVVPDDRRDRSSRDQCAESCCVRYQMPARPATPGPASRLHTQPQTTEPDPFPRSNVLVLCGTGTCLSPVAAAALRAGADTNNLSPHLTFRPAGLLAGAGSTWCAEAEALSPTAFADTWSPSQPGQVTPELVAQADLVLVTQRRHKADVRMLDPRSAHRTFTLQEAAVLGRSMVDRRPSTGPAQPPTGDLAWFVGELDALRGVVATGGSPSRWWFRFRRGSDPLDLNDPHTDGGTHRHAVMRINVAARELTAVLAVTTSLGEAPTKQREAGRHRRR
jgi:protein-tyrosine-phosphatase